MISKKFTNHLFRSTNISDIAVVILAGSNFSYLLFPTVINCSCDHMHGRCVSKAGDLYQGSFIYMGECTCHPGYTGPLCSVHYKACRWVKFHMFWLFVCFILSIYHKPVTVLELWFCGFYQEREINYPLYISGISFLNLF